MTGGGGDEDNADTCDSTNGKPEKLLYSGHEVKIYNLPISKYSHQGNQIVNFFERTFDRNKKTISRIDVQMEYMLLICDAVTGNLRYMKYPSCSQSSIFNRIVDSADGSFELVSFFNSITDLCDMATDLLLDSDLWISKISAISCLIYFWTIS